MIYYCQKGKKKHWGSPTSFWREHAPKNTLNLKNRASLADMATVSLKALANEDTLLRTHCCSWCFLGCAVWETFVADTKCLWTKSETFVVSRTQNLCPQQMLRARANGETFVSATMYPKILQLHLWSEMFSAKYCLRPRPHVYGYFRIRNFFVPDTATVHTYPANSTANP